MIRTLAPALCALSAVALGACSQQNAEFMPGGAPTAASSGPTMPATPLPAAARRASTLIGLPVQSPSGKRLGAVIDVVFGKRGTASHLIVVHTIAGGTPGTLTPIPWQQAIQHLRGDTLVLKAKRFADAPGFAPTDWPKLDAQDWSAAADAYWARTAESALTPVDPTTRSRVRPRMKL